MIEQQDPSQEYIKAFNNGYLMQQHDPELLEKLLKGNEANKQFKAMKAGKDQFEREMFLKQIEQSKKSQQERSQTKNL